MGTLLGGIAVVDRAGMIRRIFDIRSGLPANEVYSLFVDREGALWATGPSHIVRLALRSGTSVYGQQSGYPAGGSDALAASQGALYVASHSSILRLSGNPLSGGSGEFTPLGMKSSRFYNLLSTTEGLAIAHVHGLGLLSGTEMKPVPRLDDAVLRIMPSRSQPGRILASTLDRVVSVDPSTGGSRVVADSLPDYADTVVDEPSGRMWIGTPSRGLFVGEPGTTKSVPAGSRFGPLPSRGPALVSLAGDTIVVLREGGGFFLDKRSRRFLPLAGVPPGTPSAIANPDSQGAVWAALSPDLGSHSPSGSAR